ncbi:MAG: carbohydrate ABC transporter permease [Oscillospiraceae bacterium]|nr:carbohydrate ABC transporter permease [Oscillospiraceae bacterium]
MEEMRQEIIVQKVKEKEQKVKRFKISVPMILLYLLVLGVVAFTSMPLVYLVSTAFKPLNELFVFPPQFFVRNPTLRSFSELFLALSGNEVPFTRYIFNSVAVSVITVVGTWIVCTMGAFAMTKLKLPFKSKIYTIIVATLMFAAPAGQLTSYIIIQNFGWMNTIWALTLPKMAGSLFIFLLIQNFNVVPDALLEAAKIDGCSSWGLYYKMMIPMTRPAWATAIVFSFVGSWNDFFGPMLYIQREAMKTLPLALQLLQGGPGQVARAGAFAAAGLLTTLPTIIVFCFMQSKVINTMSNSGIK